MTSFSAGWKWCRAAEAAVAEARAFNAHALCTVQGVTMNDPLHLERTMTVELIPAAPFNFDPTMHKPDHFPAPDNAWEPGVRWQTMLWRGVPLGLKFENLGSVDRPGVALSIWSKKGLEAFHVFFSFMYPYCIGFRDIW